MLDIKTMRAIGRLLARQARARAVEPDVMNNEIIDLAPCCNFGKQEQRAM